jgi:hypothetical protein
LDTQIQGGVTTRAGDAVVADFLLGAVGMHVDTGPAEPGRPSKNYRAAGGAATAEPAVVVATAALTLIDIPSTTVKRMSVVRIVGPRPREPN